MCLTVKQRFNTAEQARKFFDKPSIAKKDIIVYKTLRKDSNESPYRDFKYEKGYHYYQEKVNNDDIFTNKIGYSFFSENYYIRIYVGLHAYTTSRIPDYKKLEKRVVKMIIPKGSKYFLGVNGDIVSDNLIWS